jgi:integrase
MRRGNITKRGKNSWRLKFDVVGQDGKRSTRYVTVRGSRQDAQKRLTRLLTEADQGILPEPSRLTVAAYARETLDVAKDLAPKTRERYGELLERQIAPHLGEIHLQKLTARHVESWHATLLELGLSPRTVGHAHRLLHKVLERAVKHRTIGHNVVGLANPPTVEAREVEILEPDQVKAVLDSLEGHSLHPIVSLALSTGMRRGELLGLQWQDVDLDTATVRVERSLEETRAGLRLKPPKTKRGRRSIRLPSDAVVVLRSHKLEQMQLRLQIGLGKIGAETFVFSTIDGKPLSPDNLSRDWRRVCASKGLPRVSFHSLRHTHASMLIASGVDILAVSRRLGHSRASTTLDVYGHAAKGGDEAVARAIEGLLK